MKFDDMYPGFFYAFCPEHREYKTSCYPIQCPHCTGKQECSKVQLTKKEGEKCRLCNKGKMKLKRRYEKKSSPAVQVKVKKKLYTIYICTSCGFESI